MIINSSVSFTSLSILLKAELLWLLNLKKCGRVSLSGEAVSFVLQMKRGLTFQIRIYRGQIPGLGIRDAKIRLSSAIHDLGVKLDSQFQHSKHKYV